MTSPTDDAAKLAAVRGVLSAFDWERNDRQYALEEIDRIVSADDDPRAVFIAALRDLADYLAVHPGVPAPRYLGALNVFPAGDSNDERRAAVDAAAVALGTEASDRAAGQYVTERKFGPVTYCVITIDDAAKLAAVDEAA